MRPFEGIRVIDVTHVLAGSFAAYQLGVLGTDVIKVEHSDDPDQSRSSGTDAALNRRKMGTGFLTQASASASRSPLSPSPMAARASTRPRRRWASTPTRVLAGIGFAPTDIARLRAARVI